LALNFFLLIKKGRRKIHQKKQHIHQQQP